MGRVNDGVVEVFDMWSRDVAVPLQDGSHGHVCRATVPIFFAIPALVFASSKFLVRGAYSTFVT